LARTGSHDSIINRPFLHFSYAGWNTNYNARSRQGHNALFMDLAYKVFKHDLGDVKLRNYTITQWADSYNVRWRASSHFFGFQPNGEWLAKPFVNGDPGWFVDDDSLAAYVHQGIRSAQINGNVE
jgi:hypothetical protein